MLQQYSSQPVRKTNWDCSNMSLFVKKFALRKLTWKLLGAKVDSIDCSRIADDDLKSLYYLLMLKCIINYLFIFLYNCNILDLILPLEPPLYFYTLTRNIFLKCHILIESYINRNRHTHIFWGVIDPSLPVVMDGSKYF